MKLSNYPNVNFIRTTESCNLKCVQCDYGCGLMNCHYKED